MQISSNHPFLLASYDVSEIVKPLRKLGINYFSYMKSEPNGKRTYLYSDPSFLVSYLNGKYYLAGNTECNPNRYNNEIVLWSTLPNQYIYDDLVRSRNIDHGIFIFQQNFNYCEMFSLATNKNNPGIVNTYLTNIDVLQKFTYYFKEKAADIIKRVDQHKIILPFNEHKFSFKYTESDADTINKKLHLSRRQLECSIHLMNGKTTKEIAELTGLSKRTIEYYFDNIRLKLSCNNRASLIVKLTELLRKRDIF